MLNRSVFFALTATVALVRGATAAQAVAPLYPPGVELAPLTAKNIQTDSEPAGTPRALNSFAPGRLLVMPGLAAGGLAASFPRPLLIKMPALPGNPSSNRGRHALIGGLIGGATGIIVCTAISNIVKDQGSGFTTCDTKAYIGFGLSGAALGALIGWVI
jgi:hypothetical protein